MKKNSFNHSFYNLSFKGIVIVLILLTQLGSIQAETSKKTHKNKPIIFYRSPKITDRFDRISSNGNYTLLPKGAILYLPPRLKSKVNARITKGKMLEWRDFYRKNMSLIYLVPLTKSQAFGSKVTKRYQMPYEKLEELKKLGRIIVCTYNNTPIRVRVAPKPVKK